MQRSIASVVNPKLPPSLSSHYIQVFRGWDAYERSNHDRPVVDFDLCGPQEPAKFDSRAQVLEALLELHEMLLAEAGGAVPFLRERVTGSVAYLRALNGETASFPQYVRQTLGVDPEWIPDAEIREAKSEAENRLSEYSLGYNRSDRARAERFLTIHSSDEIVDGIVGGRDLWLSRLRLMGIPVPERLDVNVEFTSVDAYWANWISGTRHRFTLRINLHPRKRYQKGGPLNLCLHEICGHAVQMGIWREQIDSGALDEACGVTTVHSPEAFAAEGLGQTVHLLLAREYQLPPELWLRKALHYHELLVLHNAHLMLYSGEYMGDVLRYADQMLPFAHLDQLTRDLNDRLRDPLSRTYLLSYSAAERALRKVTASMGDSQILHLYSNLYSQPLLPAEILGLNRPS